MRKKLCVIVAAVLVAGSLAGCAGSGNKETTAVAETTAAETKTDESTTDGGEETTTAEKAAPGELKKIVVGASPAPHAEILRAAQEVLAEKGVCGLYSAEPGFGVRGFGCQLFPASSVSGVL